MKQRSLLVLSIIILALGITIILSYKEQGVNMQTLYRTSSMQGVHLTHKDGDKIKWELTAESATFPEGKKEILLYDLTMKIHHNPNIIITGGKGNYNIEGRSLIVSKPVETTIKDSRLTTDSLTWHGEEEVVTSEDNVRLTGKKFSIEGKGLTVMLRDQTVRISSDVKGIFYH